MRSGRGSRPRTWCAGPTGSARARRWRSARPASHPCWRVIALEKHGLAPDASPGAGDVLVTGAAGGVGSVAISLLSALGYRVAASTGRPELRDYLEGLGAAELIDRAALAAKPIRPLDRERWAGAIAAVGGLTLATSLT